MGSRSRHHADYEAVSGRVLAAGAPSRVGASNTERGSGAGAVNPPRPAVVSGQSRSGRQRPQPAAASALTRGHSSDLAQYFDRVAPASAAVAASSSRERARAALAAVQAPSRAHVELPDAASVRVGPSLARVASAGSTSSTSRRLPSHGSRCPPASSAAASAAAGARPHAREPIAGRASSGSRPAPAQRPAALAAGRSARPVASSSGSSGSGLVPRRASASAFAAREPIAAAGSVGRSASAAGKTSRGAAPLPPSGSPSSVTSTPSSPFASSNTSSAGSRPSAHASLEDTARARRAPARGFPILPVQSRAGHGEAEEDDEALMQRVLEESRAEGQGSRTGLQPDGVDEEAALAAAPEEEELALAIEASTREHLAAGSSSRRAQSLVAGQGDEDHALARAIEESLQTVGVATSASPAFQSSRGFMEELDAREREMNLEDAAAGGMATALQGLQGELTEEEALQMALQASRHQLEQHTVVAQGEAALRRKAEQCGQQARQQQLERRASLPRAAGHASRAPSAASSSSSGGSQRHRRPSLAQAGLDSGSSRSGSSAPSRRAAVGKAPAASAEPGAVPSPASSTTAPRRPVDKSAALAARQASMYAAQLGLGGTGAAPKEGPVAAASASSSRSSAVETSESRDHAAAVAVEAGMIRDAQDAEYEASLAADRAKEAALLRAREEQAAAAEAERRAKEAARAEAAAEAATAERHLARSAGG
eukprot:jgi/Tetstr1/432325/TSEL_021723.t1